MLDPDAIGYLRKIALEAIGPERRMPGCESAVERFRRLVQPATVLELLDEIERRDESN